MPVRIEWRPVTGYEGIYEISNHGAVRSHPRMTRSRFGTKLTPGRVLKPEQHKLGYLRVGLSKDGKSKHKLVHRLVAIEFLPPVDGKNFVNHIDSNKANNLIENLEWCTSKENSVHASRAGLMTRTVCRRGHAFTPENTKITRTDRICRICFNQSRRKSAQQRQTLSKLLGRGEEG